MHLTLAKPSAALANYVSDYFLNAVDYPLIEDVERADVGYLRFLLDGTGTYNFSSGARDSGDGPHLLGPSTEVAHWTVQGPLRMFGAVLLPEFWGGIVEADAADYANRALCPTPLFQADIGQLYQQLQALTCVEDMARLTDAFLLKHIKPVHDDHLAVIGCIGEWLTLQPIPSITTLYAKTGKSNRQVARIANRHFGAPPRLLARKYRALRTASRIVGTRGPIPDELAAEYSDRAHMNREIRHFTGMTPKQLQVNANPVMLATLHPSLFHANEPWT